MRIYSIEKQYKAKCCSPAYKAYLTNIYDDVKIKHMSIDDSLRHYENNIDYDMNFLKVAFFKAALATIK